MPDVLLVKTLVFILASVLAVGLSARAKLPAAIGYLLAGFRPTRSEPRRHER
jgi:Kef-type K+ transport system membrane component KefB